MFNSGASLADIAAVTRGNDGFGDGGGWWVWILLFALWGGNGFGWGGNANNFEGAIQRGFDTNNIINGIRGLERGICDLGYSSLAQTNETQRTIMQGDNALQQEINAQTIAYLQGNNALSREIGDCCCQTKGLIQDLKYDMATSDCSIKTLLNQLFQQMMWGQQSGLRDLTELIQNKFCQLEMSQKDAIIADLRTQLAQCGDQNMANAIVARLSAVINPPAVPAYPAANPNGCGSWPASFLSCNSGNNCCGNWNGNCCAA